MAVFQEVKLGWGGKDFIIPPYRVLGAIAEIEQIITLPEVAAYSQRGTAPLAKLAQAFGAALRYAGAKVGDDEVYAGMLGAGDGQTAAVASVTTLLQMMMPPGAMMEKATPQGNRQPAGARLSRRATRPSSSKQKR
jgi:hypothetical protein